MGILLISMEPKLKQDVLAPPQKSNIHEYSHVLATVIYFYLEAQIHTVRLHTKCWFRPMLCKCQVFD